MAILSSNAVFATGGLRPTALGLPTGLSPSAAAAGPAEFLASLELGSAWMGLGGIPGLPGIGAPAALSPMLLGPGFAPQFDPTAFAGLDIGFDISPRVPLGEFGRGFVTPQMASAAMPKMSEAEMKKQTEEFEKIYKNLFSGKKGGGIIETLEKNQKMWKKMIGI